MNDIEKSRRCGARHRSVKKSLRRTLAALAVASCFPASIALGNPIGPQVVNGQVSVIQNGGVFQVTNSPGSIINWQGFSIAAGEITRFIQQSAASAVLNRVMAGNPSQILGALQSNGRVFLINPSGIVFGAGAQIDVAGLVASSLNISDTDFLSGRLRFAGTLGAGSVVNQGAITTPSGGNVYLVGPVVTNSGIITSPKGEVVLAAGNKVELVDPASPNLRVEISAPDNVAVNLGRITADAGRVGIYAGLIAQKGTIQADSAVVGENGSIVLKATKNTTLEAGSVTSANGPSGGGVTVQSGDTTLLSGTIEARGSAGRGGEIRILGNLVGLTGDATVNASGDTGGGSVLVGGDYQGKNPDVQNAFRTYVGPDATIKADAVTNGGGGKVVVWSDDITRYYGSISARGGAQSGDGGAVETSGKRILEALGSVNAGAQRGNNGQWLLDPNDIAIRSNANTNVNITVTGSVFDSNNDAAVVDSAQLGNALTNGTNVKVQTQAAGTNLENGDITVDGSVTASLTAAQTATLSLNAQRNIDFTANGHISSGLGSLNVNLNAGMDSALSTAGTNASHILMQAGSSISTGGGNLSATAKTNGITLAGINTGGGGTLTVDSKGGAIAQNGTITVGGTSSFTAGANSITLDDTNNAFTGAVSLSNTGANPVTVSNAGNFVLGTSSIGGSLDVTAGGTIGQNSNPITVTGTSRFVSTGSGNNGRVSLNSSTNEFVGQVTLAGTELQIGSTTGNIDLAPISGAESLFAGANAGEVRLSGAYTVVDNGNFSPDINFSGSLIRLLGDTSLTAKGNISLSGLTLGPHQLTLTNTGPLNGGVFATQYGDTIASGNALTALTIRSDGAIQLPTVNINGPLDIQTSAPIFQNSNPITVTGTSRFVSTGSGNNGRVSLNSSTNEFVGQVTLAGTELQIGSTTGNIDLAPISGAESLFAGANAGEVRLSGAYTVVDNGNFSPDINFSGSLIRLLGDTSLTAKGNISLSGLTLGPHQLTLTNTGPLNGGVFATQYGDTIASGNALTALTIRSDGAIQLPTVNINGPLDIQTSAPIFQNSNPITVTGTSRFVSTGSGNNGRVSLNSSTNEFVGQVTLAGTELQIGSTTGNIDLAPISGAESLFAGANAGEVRLSGAYTVVDNGNFSPDINFSGSLIRLLGDTSLTAKGNISLSGLTLGPHQLTLTNTGPLNGGVFATQYGDTIASGNALTALTIRSDGAIQLPIVNATNTVDVVTNNGNVTLTGIVTATGTGDALVVAAPTGNFINNVGAGALAAPNGRWLVYSTSPAGSTENGLTAVAGAAMPRLYNRTFTGNGPGTIAEPGNHLIYSAQPTLAVTADPASRAYGSANPAFTYTTGAGLVTDDGFTDTLAMAGLGGTLATAAVPNSPVAGGPYSITQGTLASSSGYALNYTGANLAVTPRPITVTADAGQNKVYGNADPTLAYSITAGNLVGADTLSGAQSRAAGENVGGYAINQGTLANSNYAITYTGNNFAITQRPITVMAGAGQNKVYGNADLALTFSITTGNLVGADTLSGAQSRAAGENVGGYAINQGTLANSNYAITYAGNNFAITPASLTITADDKMRIAGNPNPPFTASFTGLVPGESVTSLSGTLAFATSAGIASPVGNYTITPSGVSSANYSITFVDGILQIAGAAAAPQAPDFGTVPDNSALLVAMDRSGRNDFQRDRDALERRLRDETRDRNSCR